MVVGMKITYTITLSVFLIVMILYGLRARKKHTPLARILSCLIALDAITVLASMLAILLPNANVGLFFQCVHYMATEWVMIILLYFLEYYTGKAQGTRFIHGMVHAIALFCSVCLLTNPIFHHVVSCHTKEVGGEIYRMFVTKSPWYEVHEYFSYFLAAMCLLVLIDASVRTISFYRRKFYPAVIAIVLCMAAEGLCARKEVLLDYALFFYVFLGIFLIYYSLYHEHKGLITSTLSLIVSDSNSGVVGFDVDGKCIYANDQAYKIYDSAYSLEDFEQIFAEFSKDTSFAELTERTVDYEMERNGEMHYYMLRFRKLEDAKGKYIGCYFHIYDRTEDVQNYKKERYRATHDALTELYNREYFTERTERVLQAANGQEYVIAFTDIKDFKLVNDLFGFDLGNNILATFANLMKESFSENAVCGRMNSDRFAFCIPKEEFREDIIQEVIQKVAQMIDSTEYQLHMHIGVYEVNVTDEIDVPKLCDRARVALHLIKHDYEKVFSYYDAELMQQILRERHLVGEFEKALENQEFEMYLQPQVNPSGDMVGAEALVRWKHPEQGMISPGEFIPVFENAGLIHRLDCYMWELAAQKLKAWKELGKTEHHISVNISTKDFYYIDIYKTFTDLVEKYDISPMNLKLEITESAFMTEKEKQLALLERLQGYGFQVEIDDFGSGYSSLNMLKDMHADVLKIDMGFLRETEVKQRTKTILNMVVELAKNLHMTVVTEGVETKEQVEYLSTIGSDLFQGFYFDRPVSVAEFEQKYFG